MANYQNNMRYGRMRTTQSQPWQNYNCMNTENTNCNCAYSVERESQRCENCGVNRNNEERSTNQGRDTCSCQNESGSTRSAASKDSLAQMPLAMAYVPWQKWKDIYETCKGFQRGTIFAELDKPFLGRGGCNR